MESTNLALHLKLDIAAVLCMRLKFRERTKPLTNVCIPCLGLLLVALEKKVNSLQGTEIVAVYTLCEKKLSQQPRKQRKNTSLSRTLDFQSGQGSPHGHHMCKYLLCWNPLLQSIVQNTVSPIIHTHHMIRHDTTWYIYIVYAWYSNVRYCFNPLLTLTKPSFFLIPSGVLTTLAISSKRPRLVLAMIATCVNLLVPNTQPAARINTSYCDGTCI